MKYSTKLNEFNVSFFILFYVIALLLVVLNTYFHFNDTGFYQYSFFFIHPLVSKFINLFFLVCNLFLVKTIFTNKDRAISGFFPMFIYGLIHIKWWILENINYYLISDFFILIVLYSIPSRDSKKNINLLVFYLASLFGVGFLIGINFVYSFVIPILLFNLFLLSDWKSWIVFLLGFFMPLYFYITVALLNNYNPFLFLRILVDNSFYNLNHWSLSDFSLSRELEWINIGIFIILSLLVIANVKEWQDVNFYSTKGRRISLFFFFLMLFSLVNYFLIYVLYHKHAFSVIALSYAYYIGNLLNKTSYRTRYFILFLVFVITVFL